MSRCHFLFCSASVLTPLTGAVLLLVICLSDSKINSSTRNQHFTNPEDLPSRRVALVLGCSEKLGGGQTNLYFRYRMEAAAAAYHAGKCRFLIVSGDNSRKDYNEPAAMKEDLIRRGVPARRIFEDFAGFRTLDSVVRAKEVFRQSQLLVISQQFHNERAIYIGQQTGVTLTGFNARDVKRCAGWKTKTREKLARVKTLLDLHVLHKKPKFLGEPVLVTLLNDQS